QLAAFVRERRRLLALGAADVDALLEVHGPLQRGVVRGIARGDTLHALARVAVAVGAGAAGGAGLARPERPALENPEHSGIGGVVVLHRPRLLAHELVARAALGQGNLGGKRHPGERDDRERDREAASSPAQSTVIVAVSVAEKPLSPVHWNASVPLSVATVEKTKNGLAAMAGWSSARKTSVPL